MPTTKIPDHPYDFVLPSGKKLGDATIAEVRGAADFYLKQDSADTEAQHYGRWMQAIAKEWAFDNFVEARKSIGKPVKATVAS
jgi:hypothetical protein